MLTIIDIYYYYHALISQKQKYTHFSIFKCLMKLIFLHLTLFSTHIHKNRQLFPIKIQSDTQFLDFSIITRKQALLLLAWLEPNEQPLFCETETDYVFILAQIVFDWREAAKGKWSFIKIRNAENVGTYQTEQWE